MYQPNVAIFFYALFKTINNSSVNYQELINIFKVTMAYKLKKKKSHYIYRTTRINR